MKLKSQQTGATLWSMISISVLVIFFALLLIQLIPPYLADMKVRAALDSIERQAKGGTMSNAQIMIALEKRFDIDSITHVNLREDVVIEREGRMKIVRIAYEAQIPLVFNISALLEFDHSAEVRAFE
ncbi:MAG: DUF4845 domain-containing protein [Acidiferrobacterales bacterium]|jgi:hypothetical protein|nr:DUF4845 domain-containing protein [Gammaproteobacteria bacterium]